MANIERLKARIFHKVSTHLLKQGRASRGPNYTAVGTASCMYRGEDKTSCAIGCLIPDNRYHVYLEGKVASADLVLMALFPKYWEDVSASPELRDVRGLLESLQHIHDQTNPSEWAGRLEELALDFEIDLTAI